MTMERKVLTRLSGSILTAASFLIVACNSEQTNTPPETILVSDTTKQEVKSDNAFYDIPQPLQQVELLQQAGAKYDKQLLNPLENGTKYMVTNSRALNLGVYGADMCYAAVFNKPQDAILYLTASQKLAEALGIKGDFYTGVMQRLEKSSGNKDSLLQIVSYVYEKSNASLKENDQSHVSALVVAGSFVEAMFVATQVARNVEDKKAIYSRINDFRTSLNSLIGLITTVHESDFSEILSDLRSIKAIYDEQEGDLNEAQMDKVTKQVKAIRIKITNK